MIFTHTHTHTHKIRKYKPCFGDIFSKYDKRFIEYRYYKNYIFKNVLTRSMDQNFP